MAALIIESWIWWSIVMVVAINRFISRRLVLGAFRRFQWDDYLMCLVLCFYTTLIVTINIVRNTSSNLLPPGFDVASLTPKDIAARMYGSKLILVVEQCQCATIWGAKGCFIIMYLRLTLLHKENIAMKILGAYVAGSFVVMEILYFGVWCRPFWEYWAVPTNSVQCDAATNHLITNATFNLSSDVVMLLVGLPMFLRMRLPIRRKIPLVLIFSLGVFVILAACLNKVYSFTQPFGAMWTYWYVRESSTALLVANLPFVWALWRRVVNGKDACVTALDEDHYDPGNHPTTAIAHPAPLAPLACPERLTPTPSLTKSPLSSPTMTKDLSFAEFLRDALPDPPPRSYAPDSQTLPHQPLSLSSSPAPSFSSTLLTATPTTSTVSSSTPLAPRGMERSGLGGGQGAAGVRLAGSLASRRSVGSFV